MNIPEGFKLVPVELTDDMVIAFAETWYSKHQAYDDPDMLDAYRAMLAAAPTPPQDEQPFTDSTFIRGWEVGHRLFRLRLDAHKYITTGQSHVDGNGSSLEPLYRACHKPVSPPQPIYDEEKERELFEVAFPSPEGLLWDSERKQYYGTSFYWIQQTRLETWLACAQSRAKAGEVGHE